MIKLLTNPKITLREALKLLEATGKKCVIIVNKKNKLLGTLTDGDLRNHILSGKKLDETIEKVYNPNPAFFYKDKLNLKKASYIILIFGFLIGLFWLTFLSQIGILSFIDTFGAFFGPLFGLIIVDYYIVKESSLSNKDIYSIETDSSYYYSKGWHIKATYSLIIGFIFSASTIWNTNLMFLQSYAWIIGAIVSSITYYLLAKK